MYDCNLIAYDAFMAAHDPQVMLCYLSSYWYTTKKVIYCQSSQFLFNPLSPNIHLQILQTDLYTFSFKN